MKFKTKMLVIKMWKVNVQGIKSTSGTGECAFRPKLMHDLMEFVWWRDHTIGPSRMTHSRRSKRPLRHAKLPPASVI